MLALGMGTADSECLVHGSSTAKDDPMSIQRCTLHTGLSFVETCLLHGRSLDACWCQLSGVTVERR